MLVHILTFDEHDEATEICGVFTTKELAERRKTQLSSVCGYKQAIEGILHSGKVNITEFLVQDESTYETALPEWAEKI
jgi:hypothetical protein